MSTDSSPSVTSAVKTPRRGASAWLTVLIIGIVAAGAYLAYSRLQAVEAEAPVAAAIRTAVATRGPLEKVLRLGGVTSSVVYANVRVPRQTGPERRSLILLEMLPSGARVKQGEVVARIDGQSLADHIDDVQTTVTTSVADVKKRRAEQQVDLSNLEQNLRVTESNLDKWKLEAQAAEVRTTIDQEVLELGVEESEAAFEQQQQDLKYQPVVHSAELEILELTTERHKRHRDRHAYDLEKFTVASPMDGMVVRQQIYRGGEFAMVEVGDQLRSGMEFLKVMDTNNMQVESLINQAENDIKIGMKARIGLDAFPELHFEGHVYSIGALATSSTESAYVRGIPVRVKIAGAHPRLLPDLSAYVDVIVEREEDVTQVPVGAVIEEEGQAYVHVKSGDRFEKRPVSLGLRSFTSVAIESGLEPGEEVALEVPEPGA
jgi:HlyD family secretion protein